MKEVKELMFCPLCNGYHKTCRFSDASWKELCPAYRKLINKKEVELSKSSEKKGG